MSDDENSSIDPVYQQAWRLHEHLVEARRHLEETRHEVTHRYARSVLTISTSAIAFTVLVARFFPEAASRWWVLPVWILFGAAILLIIGGMRTSESALTHRLNEVEYRDKTNINRQLERAGQPPFYPDLEDPSQGTDWTTKFRVRAGTLTKWLNRLGFWAFGLGILWFVIASITAYPTLMPDEKDADPNSSQPDQEQTSSPSKEQSGGREYIEESVTPSGSLPPTMPTPEGESGGNEDSGESDGNGSDSSDGGSDS